MPSNTDSGQHRDEAEAKANEERMREIDRMREEILSSPPEIVIANHCFGLFELAAIYLSENPPRLVPATLAIDALAGLAESVKGRLGEHEQTITDGLAQLRLAFVQVSALADNQVEKN
jgi:hypothetical protein